MYHADDIHQLGRKVSF